MTPPADIWTVAFTMLKDPIAEVAPLIAIDFHGVLAGYAPMLPNPLRLMDIFRPYGKEGTSLR